MWLGWVVERRIVCVEWTLFSSRMGRGSSLCFFFNDTATTEIYTLSLHDALPIYHEASAQGQQHQAASPEGDHGVGLGDVGVVQPQQNGRAHV